MTANREGQAASYDRAAYRQSSVRDRQTVGDCWSGSCHLYVGAAVRTQATWLVAALDYKGSETSQIHAKWLVSELIGRFHHSGTSKVRFHNNYPSATRLFKTSRRRVNRTFAVHLLWWCHWSSHTADLWLWSITGHILCFIIYQNINEFINNMSEYKAIVERLIYITWVADWLKTRCVFSDWLIAFIAIFKKTTKIDINDIITYK